MKIILQVTHSLVRFPEVLSPVRHAVDLVEAESSNLARLVHSFEHLSEFVDLINLLRRAEYNFIEAVLDPGVLFFSTNDCVRTYLDTTDVILSALFSAISHQTNEWRNDKSDSV